MCRAWTISSVVGIVLADILAQAVPRDIGPLQIAVGGVRQVRLLEEALVRRLELVGLQGRHGRRGGRRAGRGREGRARRGAGPEAGIGAGVGVGGLDSASCSATSLRMPASMSSSRTTRPRRAISASTSFSSIMLSST